MRAKPSAPRKTRRVSVVVYLVAAFGTTIAALAGILSYMSVSAFNRERNKATQTVQSASKLVAGAFDSDYSLTPASLSEFASSPIIASLDPRQCAAFFGSFKMPDGHASVVRPDGSVLCSTNPDALKAGTVYAGAAWLSQTLASKTPVIGDPVRDPLTGRIAVVVATIVNGPGGRKAAFAFAGSITGTFSAARQSEQRLGTEILILDRTRTVILADTTNPAHDGRSIAGTRLARPVSPGERVIGVDGVEHIYAESVVKASGWHVLSGIPTRVAFAEARGQLVRGAGFGAASILIVLLLGFVLHRRLARPVRSLTKVIETAATDPGVRASEEGPSELARMAVTFNEMIDARERSEARFRALVLHAADMITVLDDEDRIRYCSPAATTMLGCDEASLLGSPFTSIVVDADRARVSAALAACRRDSGAGSRFELAIRRPDGTTRQVEVLPNNLEQDQSVQGLVVTVHDISERKSFEEHLAFQAFHDSLTGLPNRALVLDRLEQAMARVSRGTGIVGVLFLDLDRFKLVNDSHGHATGDRLLVALGNRLRSSIRPADTVARFGGDEFVVVCEDLSDEAEAIDIAARVSTALREPFLVDEQELFLTGSIGIALSGRGELPEDLLSNADAAMYRAKDRGRAGHAVYDEAMREHALDRLQIEAALHRAIAAESFVLHFQPKISLVEGDIVGAEALVRLPDPNRGMIPPVEFIPVAEETGLIVPLGEWVLRTACAQAVDWLERLGKRVPMAVNLSPRQLAQPSLPDVVSAILTETGLDPSMLVLEITESLLIQDADLAAHTLRRLREIGVRISIDDFGIGHSSLGYLQTFPIDELKVDRSFVDALGTPGPSAAIVGSVVGLAHAIGMSVVAEGVETPAQLSELRRLGCDAAQGYYFCYPRPASTIEERLVEDARWGSPVRTASRAQAG